MFSSDETFDALKKNIPR